MVEVEVRNFQSIEKATFHIDGFTVVVGRSNIGKSALVRAVKAALTGASAASFVRHGTGCLRRTKQAKTCKCYTSVRLQSEGFDLLWEKGDAINRYTFNGQIYDKAERGTPEFLHPFFSPVKVGDRQEILQVSDQFSPVFLLDQTGGAVADTLSDVARLDRINAAMRLSEKDRKEAAATRKVREKDILGLRAKLQGFSALDDVLVGVQRVTEQQDGIRGKEKSLASLDTYMGQLSILVQVIRGLSTVDGLVVPDSTALEKIASSAGQMGVFFDKVQDRQQGIAVLAGLDDIVDISMIEIQATSGQLKLLDSWLDQAVEIKSWMVPWKVLDGLAVPSPAEILAYGQTLSLLDQQTAAYQSLLSAVAQLERDLEGVLREGAEIEAERQEMGLCPTCIRPLTECSGVD